jgi:import receptor subunit TOM70
VAYTEAIRFKADPIYYSNRAACYSFLGNYSSVIADTNEALALDPMYIKAINRRAIAYEKEQRWDEALYGKSDTKGGKPRYH